jgi:hypothetical protein
MADEGHIANPPSKGRLGLLTLGALVAASVIFLLFVGPAEFQFDPTGFGKATGLARLGATADPAAETVAAPAPKGGASQAQFYKAAWRTDTIDIPLAAGGDFERKDELEYKVRMTPGDSMVYSWTVEGLANPEEFYFDFHGENPVGPNNPKAVVAEYRQATGSSSNGVLIAEIPGVHGWYLQNQSEKPVVVKLKIAGFYELVVPGDYGNEAGIVANKPAAPPKS